MKPRLYYKQWSNTGNLPRRTPTRHFHVAFKILYVYDFVTKLSSQKTTVVLNHENVNVRNTGQGDAQNGKCKRLKCGGGQEYDRSIV